MDHADFTKLTGTMDMVMQVSNSETFNIVAADAVSQHVPVLVSDEIPWLDSEYQANPNDVQEIAVQLQKIWLGSGNGYLQADQLSLLRSYTHRSRELWGAFLRGEHHRPSELLMHVAEQ